MRVLRNIGGWAALSLLALCCSAPASAQTDAGTAERLLRTSGLWEQLSSVAQQVRAGMEAAALQGGAALSSAEEARVARAVDTAYAAPRLRAAAVRVLVRDMQAQHVPAVVTWYGSDTGKSITKLEEAAAADTRNPDDLLAAGAARLAEATAARRDLLQQLMVAARAAEGAALMTINTAVGVQQGLAAVQPGRDGPSAEELRTALEAQRPQLQQGFAGVVLASSALTYDSASNGQLAAYLAFLTSAAGRHFSTVMEAALEQLFLDAATDLGRALPGTRENANT